MNGLGQQLGSRNTTFQGNNGPLTIDLSAANRAFAQQDLRFEQAFLDDVARDYGAGVGLVDFKRATETARRQINTWVGNETRDRIPQLLSPGTLNPLTRLVLVNAVYLKADWQNPFTKAQTTSGTFHGSGGDVSVPFMHGTAMRSFVSSTGWQAVELAYAGGQLSMTILVPDQGRYDDVVTNLSTTVLATLDAAQPAEVDLALPKFTVGHALSLKPQLSALGMPTAFTAQADFSGITTQERLQIQDVVHQANITVNEKGTVAAAAAAAIMGATAASQDRAPRRRPPLRVLAARRADRRRALRWPGHQPRHPNVSLAATTDAKPLHAFLNHGNGRGATATWTEPFCGGGRPKPPRPGPGTRPSSPAGCRKLPAQRA